MSLGKRRTATEAAADQALHSGGWVILFVIGLGGWLYILAKGPAPEVVQAWRALLVNFIFFTPLAAGMVVWSAIVLVSRGRWSGALENIALSGWAFAPVSVLALIGLWLGAAHWAPWAGQSEPVQGLSLNWLDPTFVFTRDLSALVFFWLWALWYVMKRRQGEGQVVGAWLIVIYTVVFSLLGFDLVMALDPKWYSTLFGVYFFIAGSYAAVAAWAFISAWQRGVSQARLHDLGKLIVAFSLLTAYMMYSQLLPIWYGNLAQEIRFPVPRVNFTPWLWVSYGLLALVYLGPLVLLLTIRAKRSPLALGLISLLLLAGLWFERWWEVMPTFQSQPQFGLPEVFITAAFVGAFGFLLDQFRRSVWLVRMTEEVAKA
jgi:hypothetical protein